MTTILLFEDPLSRKGRECEETAEALELRSEELLDQAGELLADVRWIAKLLCNYPEVINKIGVSPRDLKSVGLSRSVEFLSVKKEIQKNRI